MRVTESRLLQAAAHSLEAARSKVDDARNPLASGLAVAKPSDDATAWAAGRRAHARLIASTGRGRAIATSQEKLSETERALTEIGAAFVRAKELAVQAANATVNAEQRGMIALEARELLSSALGAANTKAVDGEYLLSGSQGTTEPFTAAGAYQGDGTVREIEASSGHQMGVGVTGERLTAAAGLDVFVELDRFATALATNDIAGIQTAVETMGTAASQAHAARAELGTMVSALWSADGARADLELVLAEIRGDAIDVDAVAAASRLAQASSALETSQAVSVQMMELMRSSLALA